MNSTSSEEDSEAQHLGKFKGLTYAEAAALAAKCGVSNPRLIITIHFKPETGKLDQTYPILQNEWGVFQMDEDAWCREPIEVYVVDGSKYTAPI